MGISVRPGTPRDGRGSGRPRDWTGKREHEDAGKRFQMNSSGDSRLAGRSPGGFDRLEKDMRGLASPESTVYGEGLGGSTAFPASHPGPPASASNPRAEPS